MNERSTISQPLGSKPQFHSGRHRGDSATAGFPGHRGIEVRMQVLALVAMMIGPNCLGLRAGFLKLDRVRSRMRIRMIVARVVARYIMAQAVSHRNQRDDERGRKRQRNGQRATPRSV